ncbi:HTTM domain-containing protein [Profundicola chukchiensis]|uniref:HTTM domain-containing protein n=1 Tax=Profundicola chukchiensis TaxID=2961959 RepID=UPI0026F38977|nr:HTTM domain-containing protein [Profundicola chukchiensis]
MNFLFEKVDNSKLIVFRVFFGLLVMIECWGAIATGWVKETFVDVQFTINFIGFDWTQMLVGETMYAVYGVMGFLGLLIMLGAFYRTAIILFFLLWSLTYFMQKSHYNNHYYLMMLVSFLMIWMPANNYLSLDANMNSKVRSQSVSRWNYIIFEILISCVYIFAAIAKLTPGWLNNHFLPLRLSHSAHWFEERFGQNVFSEFLRSKDLAQFLSYAGIGFDFLIVPLLLFKPTRKIAFAAAVLFHLFNSITLQIGIFPYFALALCIFFFDNKTIKEVFLPFKSRNVMDERVQVSVVRKRLVLWFLAIFTLFQIYLPLRHHLIEDDVTWTEEGHRMAWRMMLRSKLGKGYFVTHLPDGKVVHENLMKYLSNHQMNSVKTKPDMIWQFAQILKTKYEEQGIDSVKVYYRNSQVKVNDGPFFDFIDPEVDLANTKWSYFGHQKWILPSPKSYYVDLEKEANKASEKR